MGEKTSPFFSCFAGLSKVKPYMAMISLQFGYAGMYVITMVSLKHGMNHYILAVYRHLVATLVIAPFALVLERKVRPKMTLPIFLRITVLGFLEPVIDQNLYYLGMKYTTATLASATVNVLPAITFLMALIFRLEVVNLRKISSIAKVVGTVIMVPGAVIMTLYKGPAIQFITTQGGAAHQVAVADGSDKQWVSGTLMLLARCWGWSGFFILQTMTLKKHYPAELSLTALICLMGTIGGAAVSFATERDLSAWKMGWDASLLAAVYSGVICSGIAYYMQGVVIREQGPVFVTAFSPLCMIITAALGSFILAENIHLGSIIGTVLIIFGLYMVLWGKSKDPSVADEKMIEPEKLPVTDTSKSLSADKTPVADAKMIEQESPVSAVLKSISVEKSGEC